MTDLIKLTEELIREIPELQSVFYSEEVKLGEIVFSKRLEKNITQEELASLVGVKIDYIYAIEGGKKIETDILDKVLAYLNINKK